MTCVPVQRELRHHQRHPADVGEGALHPSGLLEDAQSGDLRGKPLAILGTIVQADSEEHGDTEFDLGDTLLTDVDGGRANTLNDRAR